MPKCQCGTEYVILPYHKLYDDHCPRCSRQVLSMFQPVKLRVDREGFNLNSLQICYANRGDILLVFNYNPKNRTYIVVGGGFMFNVTSEMIKKVPFSAERYIKQHYESKPVAEWILDNIKKNLDNGVWTLEE